MPHFFIKSSQVSDNIITIDDKENYTHIAKSLRVRVGESLSFCDETELIYKTKIAEVTKHEIKAEVLEIVKSTRKLDFNLSIAQSPLRSDAQLTLVEKATELGVNEIFPIHTKFCALAKHVANSKVEKWQKTMYEASKQCERANIPVCHSLTTIEELPYFRFDKVLVFAERFDEMPLKQFVSKNPISKGENILAIIGPEGGFSDKEFEWFKEKGLPLLSLGKLILKAETASITGIGNLIYGYSE